MITRLKVVESEIWSTAKQGQIAIEIRTKDGVPKVEVRGYKEIDSSAIGNNLW